LARGFKGLLQSLDGASFQKNVLTMDASGDNDDDPKNRP